MVSAGSAELLITVHEAAARLGVHPETIRRRIRRGELVAVQKASGPTAPWLLNATDIDRLGKVERRTRATALRAGRRPGQARGSARYHAESRVALLALNDARELFEHVERQMFADATLRERLERLGEEERVEAAAQELAQRVRDLQRIRARALELLDQHDG